MEPSKIKSFYFDSLLDGNELKKVHKKLISSLKKYGLNNFDAIAFRGISGALVVPTVASALGKKIIVVRKEKVNEQTHSPFRVEGPAHSNPVKYIIIDDVCSTGNTIFQIINDIRETLSVKHKPVKIFLYNSDYGSESIQGIPVDTFECN